MEQIPPPKEVKILETAEDIQERREQVSVVFNYYWLNFPLAPTGSAVFQC